MQEGVVNRQWQVSAYGGSEVLERVEQADIPATAGQAVVRVKASSINPIDWKMASGEFKWVMRVSFPYVPLFDLSGIVEAVGEGVSQVAVGDRVAVRLHTSSGGAAADLVSVDAETLVKLPKDVSFEVGAALPLVGLTALQTLFGKGEGLRSLHGERILVLGASGGVGHLAVQLAHLAEAEVVGVCSGKNVDFVTSLGADEVIDYTTDPDFGSMPKFSLIVDAVGYGAKRCTPWLKPEGRYATVAPVPSDLPKVLTSRVLPGPKVDVVMMSPRHDDLASLVELVAAGRIRVNVEEVLSIDGLPEAWQRSKGSRTVGKLVLRS